ncbi:DUF4129 domain-containing protein [Sinomicrobium soli]|nr:DUF4129 domain-containing protein [Sinomicrobium sp. N-1-3-6]
MKRYLLAFILAFIYMAPVPGQDGGDSLRIDRSPVEKRVFTENPQQKYQGEEYTYEYEAASGWFSRFKEWFVQKLMDLFRMESRQKAADITDFALKVFYIVIILAVIYFIIRAIINREGRWIFRRNTDRSIIVARDIENNIHVTDFQALVRQAVAEKRYREAIRYHYLWLLKELSERALITYDVEKTNNDYQAELQQHPIGRDFRYAAYLYTYIWYGEFEIDQLQYTNAAGTFSRLITSVAG